MRSSIFIQAQYLLDCVLWPNEKNETQFIIRISREARVNSGSGARVCRHKWKREGLSKKKSSGERGSLLAH